MKDDNSENGITQNERLIRTFAGQFDPAPAVGSTMRINGHVVQDGWVCSVHIQQYGIGITVTVHGPQVFHGFIEAGGVNFTLENAIHAGQCFAKALALLPEVPNGKE